MKKKHDRQAPTATHMAVVSTPAENEICDAEPLLNDTVSGSVDSKGRPSLRPQSGSWKSASFLFGVGVVERFAYYGTSSNLVSYLTGKMGQPTADAAAMLNAWYGTAALLPILGAFVADSFSGRYWTVIIASLLYIMALGFLTLSAALNSINCKSSANQTCSPSTIEMIFFYFAVYLVALAQGGHAPCIQAFGADQFDEEEEKECNAKSSFFNWWYWFSVGGILVPLLVLNYIQENVSWSLSFGILCILMFFALILFLIGTKRYRFRVKTDARNPFMRIGRVFVSAARNWMESPQQNLTVEGSHQFKFLDRALLIAEDSKRNDEDICRKNDVEDARAILSLIPIWCTTLGYSIIYALPAPLFTKQAATIDRRIGSSFIVPATSYQQLFITIPLLVSIPLYDRFVVPIVRTFTRKPSGISMLQRIGIGLFLSLVSIVFAAFVERKRLAAAAEYGLVDDPNATIPISGWWLAPQYVLSGVADVFAMIGLQEFFYDQIPDELKSIGLAMYLSILGIGSYLSGFLVSIVEKLTTRNGGDGWIADNLNKGHLDYYYWLLAGISVFEFAAYLYFSKYYVYKRKVST